MFLLKYLFYEQETVVMYYKIIINDCLIYFLGAQVYDGVCEQLLLDNFPKKCFSSIELTIGKSHIDGNPDRD